MPSYEDLEKQYREQNPPDFNTHANYIRLLNATSKDMGLEFSQSCKKAIKNPSKLLNKKINLIQFTLRSISEEYKIILDSNDFAVVCCSWIPVKSYYVIFNSLLVLQYLITCDEKALSSAHSEINNDFKGYIERNEIKFSKDCFNKVYKGEEIEKLSNWKSGSGESLKKHSFNEEDRFKHILKKIIEYKKEEFKRMNNIKSLSGKAKKDFLSKTKINLSDFFYCYRIKANYGGMDFLDKDISDLKFKEFFNNYSFFTVNYYKCLKKLINELAVIRLGEKIL